MCLWTRKLPLIFGADSPGWRSPASKCCCYCVCCLHRHRKCISSSYLSSEVPWLTTLLMHSSAFTGCGSQSTYSTSSLFWQTRCYMEAHHLAFVHSSASLIFLVDEHCILLAPTVLLCHLSNCLQSAVEPSRLPLPNSETACLTTPCWQPTEILSVPTVLPRCCTVTVA